MNRARRRQMGKELRKDIVVLTKDQLDQIKRDAVDQVCHMDVEALLTCFAQVLHDQYGWGHVRITRALSAVDETFGQVLDGDLSLPEMKKRLREETGVKILCDD